MRRWGNMLVFTETSSGKYYRETSAIKYSEDARRRRDATLSNFQALPFARPILITFRVLKRNYLGPSPPAPPRDPLPEMRRAGKTRGKRYTYKTLAVSVRRKSGQSLKDVDVMIFFLHFREHSVHERLLSEKQLKHGRVISTLRLAPAGRRPVPP
ncbi:jg8195 [Pararge aegeria aegeria]|uniref:Jg8195 protein n=1 Tax=Pararge aegeria aegeria TaxID=348720 RepID=A0A8S4SLC1_9NEOP|nr:jg8195 [Pararge aegeria aegeria]